MRAISWAFLAVLVAGSSCRKSDDYVVLPLQPPPQPPTPTIITSARIPPGTNPPVGVTFEVLFDYNASLTEFALMQTVWNNASAAIWQITEGQTYIAAVNMSDTATGSLTNASALGTGFNPTAYDVVAYDPVHWDVAPAAETVFGAGYGRSGRLMAVPGSPAPPGTNPLLHEIFRFLYELSWLYYQMTSTEACLDDEDVFFPDDTACVMENTFGPPLRLCYAGDHLTSYLSTPINAAQIYLQLPNTYLNGQPRSCWEQILADYPGMSYTGMDSTPFATPTVGFTINDAP